jgi:uncharacterized protein YbjT (DUF2867 family)
MKADPLILSVGANGRFAGLVVPELIRRGARVRGMVRDPEHAEIARAKGATEIVIADLRDPESLDKAVKGVDGVFYIGPAFERDESQMGLNMLRAALRARVRRFVFSSVMHPTLHLQSHFAKASVEAAVYSSGLEFVVLQPATLYQNLESGWQNVLEHHVIAEPFSRQARVARVDYRDVAEVAAIGLTDDRLNCGTFELCAEGLPNREDIARVMSEVLGTRVEAAEPSFTEWSTKAHLPYDEWQRRQLRMMFEYYGKYGAAGNSSTLRSILGREPRTLHQFVLGVAAQARTVNA